jgi:hypothetical protein
MDSTCSYIFCSLFYRLFSSHWLLFSFTLLCISSSCRYPPPIPVILVLLFSAYDCDSFRWVCRSGKNLGLYLGGARLEPRPGHCLSRLIFLMVFLLIRQMSQQYLDYAMTTFFREVHQSVYHPRLSN